MVMNSFRLSRNELLFPRTDCFRFNEPQASSFGTRSLQIVSVTNWRRQPQVRLGGGHCKKWFQKFCLKSKLWISVLLERSDNLISADGGVEEERATMKILCKVINFQPNIFRPIILYRMYFYVLYRATISLPTSYSSIHLKTFTSSTRMTKMRQVENHWNETVHSSNRVVLNVYSFSKYYNTIQFCYLNSFFLWTSIVWLMNSVTKTYLIIFFVYKKTHFW